MLNRMKEAMDNILRQEQAGFRKGRSCCEQIFTLRQIIEKVHARDRSLYTSFIHFQKVFDSIHRMSLREILKCYGIPEKLRDIIKSFYDGGRSNVRINGLLSDWLEVCSGVRQGCLLLPLLFAVVTDWCMKHAVHATDRNATTIYCYACFLHSETR